MVMTLDKGLETERVLELSSVNEIISENALNGTNDIHVDSGADLPDLSAFLTPRTFDSVELVTDNGVSIPIACQYNFIQSLNVNFNERSGIAYIGISLTYRADLEEVENA